MSLNALPKDVLKELLLKMTDKDILTICNMNTYYRNKICDDNFFHRILLTRYPDTLKNRDQNRSYKKYYIDVIIKISIMKEKYNYTYEFGNLELQYNGITKYSNDVNLLLYGVNAEQLALVMEALKRGADIHYYGNTPLNYAITKNNLDIVKYLLNYKDTTWGRLTIALGKTFAEDKVLEYLREFYAKHF